MNILKKITDRKILYIFTLCIIVFLPILKQLSFYFVKFGFITNYDSINPVYIFCFSAPFLIYVYIKNLIDTKRKLDIFDYLFYILVVVGIFASLFAIDKEISFLGKDYRHEGFISLLCYYLLFINWKVGGTKEDIKQLLNVIIIMTIISGVYGILQIYSPFTWILRFANRTMAAGISGNPNFFGSLMVTTLSIVITKYLIEDKKSITSLLLIILLFVSLINSKSLGPILTLILTLIFIIIFLFIKKKIKLKKLIILILTLIITYIGVIGINKVRLNIDTNEIGNTVAAIKNESLTTEEKMYIVGSGRFKIWKNSLNIVKDNFIIGVGYDNFQLAYYEGVNLTEVEFYTQDGVIKSRLKYPEITDNAHNIYLHTLVSSGLLGLIPYLILCLLVFIKGLKTKSNLMMILLGGFVAYSIQAFANISVIQVAPIYYIIMGLMLIKE